MTLPIIDFVFFVILFAMAMVGSFKGFIRELFDKGAPVIGVWTAILFYRKLSKPLLAYVRIPVLSAIIAFIVIFILAFLIVKIVQQIVGNIFGGHLFRQLDHTLGFFFGLLEGFALIAIILIVLTSQPWFDVSSLLDGSLFYKIFLKFPVVLDAVTKPLPFQNASPEKMPPSAFFATGLKDYV